MENMELYKMINKLDERQMYNILRNMVTINDNAKISLKQCLEHELNISIENCINDISNTELLF